MPEAAAKFGYNFHELQPVLLVRDVAASVAYYCDILGFIERGVTSDENGVPQYAIVRHDRITLRLQRETEAEIRTSGSMYIHLGHADGSEDMDGLFREYQNKGVPIVMEPTVQPWGLREFEIEDINGHRFHFAVDARPYVLSD